MHELAHIVLERLGTVLCQICVVLIRRLGRSISVDFDVCYGCVLVVLHEVDCVHNLLQLARVVAVFGIESDFVNGEVDKRASFLMAHLLCLGCRAHIRHERRTQALQLNGVLVFHVAASAEVFCHDDVRVLHPGLIGQHGAVVERLVGVVLTSYGHHVCRKVLMSAAAVRDVLLASVHYYLRHLPLLGVVSDDGREDEPHVRRQLQRVHIEVEVNHHSLVSVLYLDILYRHRPSGQLRLHALCLQRERRGQQACTIYR